MDTKYYTVFVYTFSGVGSVATFTNILATSDTDAIERVKQSFAYYRQYPMAASEQKTRVF